MTDQHVPMSPAERRAEARTYAGFRSVRTSPLTGTTIVVLNSDEAGLDGAWTTLCDEHAFAISHDTRRLAEYHAADPLGWCETCMSVLDVRLSEHLSETVSYAGSIESIGAGVERVAIRNCEGDRVTVDVPRSVLSTPVDGDLGDEPTPSDFADAERVLHALGDNPDDHGAGCDGPYNCVCSTAVLS